MMEYTLVAMLAVIVTITIDHLAGTRVTRRAVFWVFMLVMVLFKLIVNGWLTWRLIVIYDERFQLGVRVGTIPVEDFLFGFALILLTVIVWEKLKRRTQ